MSTGNFETNALHSGPKFIDIKSKIFLGFLKFILKSFKYYGLLK